MAALVSTKCLHTSLQQVDYPLALEHRKICLHPDIACLLNPDLHAHCPRD